MDEVVAQRERMTIMRSMFNLVKRRENRKGKEAAYELLMMIVEYGLNGVVPEENSELYDSFIIIAPTVDHSNCRSDWGKQGGRGHTKEALKLPLQQAKLPLQPVKVKDSSCKHPLYDVDGDVDVDVDVDGDVGGAGGVSLQKPSTRKHSLKRFVKPTLEEIEAYCLERNNGINAKKFLAHYEMVGWVVGKSRTPMKDWKGAIRMWEQNDIERREESVDQRGGGPVAPFDPSQRRLRELKPADAD